MQPQSSRQWTSMTRVGQEFGWSVVQTARVLAQHGYRRGAYPTPKSKCWVRLHPNPLGGEAYRWDLVGMVEQLQALGYEKMDPVELQIALAWQDCRKFNAYRAKYIQGAKRKELTKQVMEEVGRQLHDRLAALSSHGQAQVLLEVDRRMQDPANEGCWSAVARRDAWKWLRITEQDLQAYALLLATDSPRGESMRRRI